MSQSTNICSSGISAIWRGTICNAKMMMKIAAAPLNGIHERAYAAMAASTVAKMTTGTVIAIEFTKYEPSWGAEADEANSTSL